MKKYDLIFGIGEACSCTQVLRKMNLQFYSYPFDWLYGTNFENRINIITEDFKDFLNKEDLEFTFEVKSINCNAYYNKANQITFNHDFLKNLSFDEAYNLVSQKYKRRITRLLNQIKSSNSILIVYLEVPRTNYENIKEQTIINAFEKLKIKYPDKQLDLFYIKNDFNQTDMEVKPLSDYITLFELNYKQINDTLDYLVDMNKLYPIFNDIKLKNSDLKILKKNFHNMWISLVPIKSLRHNLRKKYHV